MLNNTPIEYKYMKMPEGYATVTNTQDFSRSDSITVTYNTPKYKGEINWCHNEFYGYLATRFDFEGKVLHGCNGEKIHVVLGIPEDYCKRIGFEGYDKFITKEYFEMWLQTY